jgi:hypothetical protein
MKLVNWRVGVLYARQPVILGDVCGRVRCKGTLIFIIESTDSSRVSYEEAVVRWFRELLALLPFAGRICQFIIFQKMKGLRAESASLPFSSLPFPSLRSKNDEISGPFCLKNWILVCRKTCDAPHNVEHNGFRPAVAWV